MKYLDAFPSVVVHLLDTLLARPTISGLFSFVWYLFLRLSCKKRRSEKTKRVRLKKKEGLKKRRKEVKIEKEIHERRLRKKLRKKKNATKSGEVREKCKFYRRTGLFITTASVFMSQRGSSTRRCFIPRHLNSQIVTVLTSLVTQKLFISALPTRSRSWIIYLQEIYLRRSMSVEFIDNLTSEKRGIQCSVLLLLFIVSVFSLLRFFYHLYVLYLLYFFFYGLLRLFFSCSDGLQFLLTAKLYCTDLVVNVWLVSSWVAWRPSCLGDLSFTSLTLYPRLFSMMYVQL